MGRADRDPVRDPFLPHPSHPTSCKTPPGHPLTLFIPSVYDRGPHRVLFPPHLPLISSCSGSLDIVFSYNDSSKFLRSVATGSRCVLGALVRHLLRARVESLALRCVLATL